jgi:hypothetical protein
MCDILKGSIYFKGNEKVTWCPCIFIDFISWGVLDNGPLYTVLHIENALAMCHKKAQNVPQHGTKKHQTLFFCNKLLIKKIRFIERNLLRQSKCNLLQREGRAALDSSGQV